ncbi:MAG: hypothetical protein EBV86_01750 [Marivivens sp.]|nr:hypothetical protein [Marivivens sp.]
MWYEWNTLDDFNTWHENLKNALGYPLLPINQLTGLPDINAQATENYTEAIAVEGKFIAYVEVVHADGLTETELRPVVDLEL